MPSALAWATAWARLFTPNFCPLVEYETAFEAGAEVTVDGIPIPPDQYLEFGGDWEAARYTVSDGVHQLEGTEPFSVVVVGFDGADSYAYLGGSSTGKINPAPQG